MPAYYHNHSLSNRHPIIPVMKGEPDVEDSLDNISARHRLSSLERSKSLEVKRRFVTALEKLQCYETREIGLAQVRRLFDANRDQLHMFLTVTRALKPSSNSAAKEHEVLVVSLFAEIFKEGLQDPSDKPPSVTKTCFKLVQCLHSYFTDGSPTVQMACARVLLDMVSYCLLTPDAVRSVVLAPLTAVLRSGVDRAAQATASVCLYQLITYCSKRMPELLPVLSHELLSVLLKVNSEYPELFSAAVMLIDVQGVGFFEGKVSSVLGKVLPVIHGSRDTITNYLCKVNVCRIVERAGRLLDMHDKAKLAPQTVEECLEKASRNRVIQVQMAAHRALKVWKGEQVPPQAPPLTSLQQARDNRKKERSNSLQHKSIEKIQMQLNHVQQDLQNMVKGGWGASHRAKQFVRRGTGIGGGAKLDSSPSPQNKPSKSHKEHLQELRDHIRKATQSNKNVDKFTLLQDKPRNKSPSPIRKQQKKQLQFAMQEEGGDQAVSSKPSYFKSNDKTDNQKKKQKLQNNIKEKQNQMQAQKISHFMGGMSPVEIKQLLNHQESLMQDAEISMLTESKALASREDIPSKKEKIAPMNIAGEKPRSEYQSSGVDKREQRSQKSERSAPVSFQKIDDGKAKIKWQIVPLQQKKAQQKASLGLLSQQQISELVNECDLSQMSDNLDGLLNESDMVDGWKLEMMDSGIVEQERGEKKVDLRTLIKESKGNQQSRLALNKFMKQPLQIPLAHSLNFTESNPSREVHPLTHTDESSFHKQKQIDYSHPQPNPQPHLILDKPVPHDPPSEKAPTPLVPSQFTLNPHDKYSSLKHPTAEEDQIEEDIVMSEYEQSAPAPPPPKQQHIPIKPFSIHQPIVFPNLVYQPQVLQYDIQNHHKQHPINTLQQTNKIMSVPKKIHLQAVSQEPPSKQEESKIYQGLIKNPPLKEKKKKENIVAKGKEDTEDFDGWKGIINSLQEGNINDAFERAFANEDPIDLLRLMVVSDCPIRQLTAANAANLWDKFLEIYNHRLIDVLFVKLFKEAQELGVLKACLSVQDIKDILLELFDISGGSKGKLSYHAATLYNSIDSSLKQ